MGSLAHLKEFQRPLAREVHQLASLGVRLEDSNEGGVIMYNKAESSFVAEVKEKQFNDPLLRQLKEGSHKHKTTAFSFGMDDGTLWYQGRLCVPDIDGLRERIMAKAHTSRYSVHPGSTKMYHDLKEVYRWNNMKKDVADFVAKCPNCQQVKVEHQRPGRLAQRIEIPIWKWEMINMDFVVGLPHTPRKLDSIWVMEKVNIINERLKTAQSRQKSYSNVCHRDLEFKEDDWVFLKVSPMKGIMRFGKKGKLSPRYVRPSKIIQRIGQVAYKLEMPPEVSLVHPVFHVSMLKKVVGDPSTIVPVETIEVNEELSYEEAPVAILDRQVQKLRNK
ncbi:uncharacterized protein [Nicotiana sylvestris]|uniref:uncharacterized protein n=1 Tax=Nicotiana sylvestris TaxID=4096 RepID=UPI00388C65BC